MHVSTKKLCLLGILLALATILILASAALQFNTLFLFALASYLLGIAILETGLRAGAAYLVAAVLLAFFVVPQKLQCVTYSAFLIYIYITECLRRKKKPLKRGVGYLIKLLFFDLCFLAPALIFFPKLLITRQMKTDVWFYAGAVVVAQVLLLLFDYAYEQFCVYWLSFRKRLRL